MAEHHPNGNGNGNGNGSWRTWILSIIAGLVLLGIVGSIVINRDVARQMGEHSTDLGNIKERTRLLEIDIRRIDALAAERGIAIPRLTSDVKRLEDRLDRLDIQRPR